MYELLAGLPERALPETLDKVIPVWGTMTGIRPARTPMKELLAGVDEEDVRRELTEVYRFRSDRASLCMEIARKEASLLKQLDYQNGYSLYLGIPFCPSRCLYCSFPAYPIAQYQELVPAYLEALQKEIKACGRMMKARRLTSVYLGGGTPTALSADQLKRLMDDLYQSFPMEEAAEITVEAGRPDSITIEKIQALRSMGTTRISVNPQTMKDATLIRIGRRHTVKMVQESLELARQCGFDQINMDLIMGLPGETAADFQATLGQLRSLEPENVTIHSLVIKRASALRETLERTSELGTGRRDMLEQMLQIGLKEMAEQGLLPYYIYRQKNASGFTGSTGQENIGFAKKGTECLYNILMMEEMQSILALGAGASTKWYDCQRGTVRRIENVKSVTDYVGRIDEMIMRKAETIQREPGL